MYDFHPQKSILSIRYEVQAMEVQRACTMFENNLDRAQTNSVETIGEYNNIVPICSWSAWWTKEEGRGEGVKNRNESIEIERRRRSKVSINERREKARGTRGQRVRGVCVGGRSPRFYLTSRLETTTVWRGGGRGWFSRTPCLTGFW